VGKGALLSSVNGSGVVCEPNDASHSLILTQGHMGNSIERIMTKYRVCWVANVQFFGILTTMLAKYGDYLGNPLLRGCQSLGKSLV
jgi:hypothetical protein